MPSRVTTLSDTRPIRPIPSGGLPGRAPPRSPGLHEAARPGLGLHSPCAPCRRTPPPGRARPHDCRAILDLGSRRCRDRATSRCTDTPRTKVRCEISALACRPLVWIQMLTLTGQPASGNPSSSGCAARHIRAHPDCPCGGWWSLPMRGPAEPDVSALASPTPPGAEHHSGTRLKRSFDGWNRRS